MGHLVALLEYEGGKGDGVEMQELLLELSQECT